MDTKFPPAAMTDGKSEIQKAMLPQNQSFGMPATVFGLLCRFLITLSAAYGTCLMLCDSFRIYKCFGTSSLQYAPMFYLCLAVCGGFALCEILKNVNRIAGAVASYLAGVLVLAWALRSNIVTVLVYALPTFWNYMLTFLITKGGYTQLSHFRVWMSACNPDAFGNDNVTATAYLMLVILICFVCARCIMRKVRVLPVIILTGLVITVSFTYNLIDENYGFTLIAAAAFGIFVMKCYDSFFSDKRLGKKKKAEKAAVREEKAVEADERTDEERFMDTYGISYKKSKRKKRGSPDGTEKKPAKEKLPKEKPTKTQLHAQLRYYAVGGIAGFLIFAIAGGVMAYPAAVTEEPWDDIPVLDSFMDAARDFVYEYISGDAASDQTDANFAYSGPRTITPTDRNLTEKILIQIDSNSKKTHYLRCWTGELYGGGEWTTDTTSAAFKASAGWMSDDAVELFYDIVDYQANHLSGTEYEDSNSRDKGFYSTLVSLKNIAIKSDMFCLPSRFSTSYGLLEYNSVNFAPYTGAEYKNYYGTGMLVTDGNKTTKKAEYSAVAHIPFYNTAAYTSTMENDMAVFELVLNRILSDDINNTYTLRTNCEKQADEAGLTLSPNSIVYRFTEMTQAELSELSERVSAYLSYGKYVTENYTSVPADEAEYLYLDALTASGRTEAFDGTESYEEIYKAIENTVRWLSDNTSYRLSPTGYTDDGASYIYQFLHTAKNGYCVQYASSAALLLRSLGIPTRYVEGFMVDTFFDSDEDSVLRYTGYARDKNAHAWVEAYINGYGWITVEATKPYVSSLYGQVSVVPSDSGTAEPGTSEVRPTTQDSTPVTTIDETEVPTTSSDGDTTEEGGVSGGISEEALRALVITALILAAVLTAVYLVMKTGRLRSQKTSDVLHKTAAGENDELKPSEFIEKYQNYIFKVLRLCGAIRGKQELLSDFAARADALLDSGTEAAEAADAIQKNAYGHDAGIKDCAAVARYALTLKLRAAVKLPWYKKLLYRDILKLIS